MKKIFTVLGLASVLLIVTTSIYGQYMYKVSGCVTDAVDGDPLIGATVRAIISVPHYVYETTTDVEGYYLLPGNYQGNTLRFSYVGYKDTLVKVKAPNQIINVALVRDVNL